MELTINNQTYDVSEFVKRHPGGAAVLEPFLGRDASDVFQAFHSKQAYELLQQLPVVAKAPQGDGKGKQEGNNKKAAPAAADGFDKDMRELRGRMVSSGLFRGSVSYFARKVGELHLLLAASFLLLRAGSPWGAAAALGLFFQQAGWAAHCFLHQAVFSSWRWNYAVGNYYLNILLQGFSASWWNDKHFKHHALPNGWLVRKGGELVAFDNDVDTAPYLLWVPHMAATLPPWAVVWLLPYQHLYATVLLAFAKWSWNLQSLLVCLSKRCWIDLALSLSHYALFLSAGAALTGSWLASAVWFARGVCIGGFFLSFVFIQSHFATTELCGANNGFYTSQMLTTRNISTDALTTWFTGGLNYQIEHHLFPRLPRHNYGKVAPQVKALCSKHGIKYEELGVLQSTALLLRHLHTMGRFPTIA